MATVTHKNLFSLVNELVDKRVTFRGTDRFKDQSSRFSSIQPFALSNNLTADISAQELVRSVQTVLGESVSPKIIDGLDVTAQNPVTDKVLVTAGKGTVGGNIYTLDADVTLTVPFDSDTNVFFITLFRNGIFLSKNEGTLDQRLIVAKIIVPLPGTTDTVRDNDNGSSDAYILQRKEITLYGNSAGKFEEDTLEVFKDNIGDVLAETIVGTITLNENLKITNSTGTIIMNSQSLDIQNNTNNVLARFNRNGVFFFDVNQVELAKFGATGARVGNIEVLPNALQSDNFVSGLQGFQLSDSGDVEFNNLTVRGTVFATAGEIGGWTIASDKLYGTGTGAIQTALNVAAGQTGVIMDTAGLRGFDSILGKVFDLPTDGSAPTFSSGIINSTIFEIQTNAILRTSETVGDGSANSAGILINNTGLYGAGANQALANANLKALIDGTIRLEGEIVASTGQIGNVTITSTKLSGGLIEGVNIISPTIQTSATVPHIVIDGSGIKFEVSETTGKYGVSGSGALGFQYGDGTSYGTGLSSTLFNPDFPTLAILSEGTKADIRMFNRGSAPGSGTGPFVVGDLIVVNGSLQIYNGTAFEDVGTDPILTFPGLTDTPSTYAGSGGFTVKVNAGATALEFVNVTAGTFADDDLGNLASVAVNTSLLPATDDTIDLGSATKEWQDIWIDGTATIDAIDMGGNIDFNKNQAVAMRFENRTSDPTSPSTGQVWIRTDI